MSNPELDLARRIVENTGTHLFLTGKAGTGKTTFLKDLKQRSPKRMVVTAPTGIAAINAGGMTLHSFFQLPLAPYVPDSTFRAEKDKHRYKFSKEKKRLIRSLDLLVIDEISMVRADILDAVDAVLRRFRVPHLPFGGVQLLMIGDLQQLAPVVKPEEWDMLSQYYDTPFFFSSRALSETHYATVELKQTYRQTDEHFLALLNNIRTNRADASTLEQLNKRYMPDFTPPASPRYIRLTTHNVLAQSINDGELEKLDAPTFTYQAKITGNFPEYNYPTEKTLTLKEGAQVMFIKNDHSGEGRYFNGMIGEIVRIDNEGFVVHSQDFNGEIRVQREQWDNTRYTLNEQTMEINEEVEGSFEQFPVRLAWAITIHKSQGLTFSHAIIDARDSFAHGQVYVALSRCRTLEGMVLSSPLSAGAIICDTTVNNFNASMASRTPGATAIDGWEKRYYHQLLQELFGFETLMGHFNDLHRLVAEHFGTLDPQMLEQFNLHSQTIQNKLCDIATRFSVQYTRIISEQADYASSTLLKERIHNASRYFLDEFTPICLWAEQLSIPTDNKELKKRIDDYTEKLVQSCMQKSKLLEFVHEEGFDISSYLHKKAVICLEVEEEPDSPTPSKSRRKKSDETILQVPSDIVLPDLYQSIVSWRQKKAQELGIPTYCVLQQKALMGIVHFLPDNPKSLLKIPYMGKTSVEKYGNDLLEIVTAYMKENNLTTKI